MKAHIRPSSLSGNLIIPASKSHTIRALLIATLAPGRSIVANPLDSNDARSCIDTCQAFGAEIQEISGGWQIYSRALEVQGIGNGPDGILRQAPKNIIDVGNSGTTEYLAAGIAALSPGYSVFTGDHQIRNRPVENLLASLRDLGAQAFTTRNNGKAPFVLCGPLLGGKTKIECPTSQFLSSLMLALPLAQGNSEIEVSFLYEQPYAEMTAWWLEKMDIKFTNDNWKRLTIPGNQQYKNFEMAVPGDFSSATFFGAAAAITGSKLTLEGLDMADSQGDKVVFRILSDMGCQVEYLNKDMPVSIARGTDTQQNLEAYEEACSGGTSSLRITGPQFFSRPLLGGTFDLNPTPDALPALAVTACFATEKVELIHVPQARLKETDRISVMKTELTKMGADIQELPDGLVIHPMSSPLRGTEVEGWHDHRVVMSLSIAGLAARGDTWITDSEAAGVTFPGFFEVLESARG